MYSIRTRLNWAFIALTIVMFVLLCWGGSWLVRQTAYEFVIQRMSSEAYSLLRALEKDQNEHIFVNRERISAVYQQPMSGRYYQIYDQNHWHYSRSLWDQSIPLEGAEQQLTEPFSLYRKAGKPWLVMDQVFQRDGRPVRMVLANDVSRIEEALRQLVILIMLAGVVFVALVLAAQVWIVRKGLGVLSEVRDQVTELKQGDIRQLPATQSREIEPLVTEINYLVESMEMRLQRSRNAVGNLAHAAKTPLTVLDRQLETLAEHDAELAERMHEQSRQLRQLMERELTRARIAGAALPGQRVFLEAELDKLISTLQAIYRDRNLELIPQVESEAYFPGERDDLMEMLGNLLDNACKWARRQVRIYGYQRGDELELVIEDDGPGVDNGQIERMLNRGERLDESRAGHGLGLSIVQDIVTQYRGEIALGSAELGGLQVRIKLPCRASAE